MATAPGCQDAADGLIVLRSTASGWGGGEVKGEGEGERESLIGSGAEGPATGVTIGIENVIWSYSFV